jgi:hypothetical protein
MILILKKCFWNKGSSKYLSYGSGNGFLKFNNQDKTLPNKEGLITLFK